MRVLAYEDARNMMLVTATPHSGIELSFRLPSGMLDRRVDTEATGEIGRRHCLMSSSGGALTWRTVWGARRRFPSG